MSRVMIACIAAASAGVRNASVSSGSASAGIPDASASARPASACIRALKTVVAADGVIHDLERGFAESLQRHVLHTDFDFDSIAPIDGPELARIVPPGEFRERIVRGAIVAALIDGEASEPERQVISNFSRALAIGGAPLRELERLVAGRLLL